MMFGRLKEMLFKRNDYIFYDNRNSQHNDGCVNVYLKGKLVEWVFVDEYLEENKDPNITGVYDIIDMFKEKYSITKVKEDIFDWR